MADFKIENNGIIFPLFLDIKKAMEQEGKIQFGDDFEINPETSLGQFLEVFIYMLENQSKQLQLLYSQMWLHNKNGAILSAFGSNFGIERIKGKYAYGNLNIEGVPGHIVTKGFQVRSKKGLLYQTVSNVLINNVGKAVVQIKALDFGEEYNASENEITEKATGDENVSRVYNSEIISGGTFLESDEELRKRILNLSLSKGGSDINGIKSNLLRLSQVEDCDVLENSTDERNETLKLDPGHVRIIIKGLIDEEVAYTVLNTISPGIVTDGDVEMRVTTDSNQERIIKFKKATKVEYAVRVRNIKNISDYKKTTKEEIVENIIKEADKFRLGQYVNYEKIQAAVYKIADQLEADVEIKKINGNWTKTDLTIQHDEYSFLSINNIEVEL
jgi:baseplate J-like protein